MVLSRLLRPNPLRLLLRSPRHLSFPLSRSHPSSPLLLQHLLLLSNRRPPLLPQLRLNRRLLPLRPNPLRQNP